MIKKLQFSLVTMMLLLSVHVNADEIIVNSNLDLYNPDVRKCLLDATKQEGWELKSVYLDSEDKLIMIFDKGNDSKIYKTK